MALEITSGEAIAVPARAALPDNAGKRHYLDGAPLEEVDGIRVVGIDTRSQGASYASDNIDPTDLPAASGSKKKLVGTSGVSGFVNNVGGVVRNQTGTVASVSLGFRAYPDAAGATTTDTGPPFVYKASTATAGTTPNGKRAWYTTKMAIPSAGSSTLAGGTAAFGLGLQSSVNGATTTLASIPTKGLWFNKVAANTTVDFKIGGAGVSTALTDIHTLAGVTALALDTFFEYSFRIDEVGNITVYVNGLVAGTVAAGTTNLPAATDFLTTFHGRDNVGGTTVAQKLDQDYELYAQEV